MMSLVGLDSLCAPFLSLNFNDEGKVGVRPVGLVFIN